MANKYNNLEKANYPLSKNCSWTYSPGQAELHKLGHAEEKDSL